jgi:hypothetical protein
VGTGECLADLGESQEVDEFLSLCFVSRNRAVILESAAQPTASVVLGLLLALAVSHARWRTW